MRELKTYVPKPINRVVVVDEEGSGGANHHYRIFSASDNLGHVPYVLGDVVFQNGPVENVSVNGVTHEALLQIIIDRLQSFQKGPYSCRENALALTNLEEALHWLNARTHARMQRGVEGTHTI